MIMLSNLFSFLIAILAIFTIKTCCTESTLDKELLYINLAVVVCGDRGNETLTLLKSALMFTKSSLHFYILTEPQLKSLFTDQFNKWPKYIQKKFNYTLMNTQFPAENEFEWRQLFKLCASQRIFLPSILKSVDSLIYVDTDVLFLTDLADLWSHFSRFNKTQLAALAPEHEETNMGWYNRFARHPYYGQLGLNSGVMLMNLTRMREFKFVDKIYPLFKAYKYNITWGDQCLLNILFHFHPDKLYVYDCSWNYRPDHCMYGSNCKIAEREGVRVLHGCRRVFQNEKEPAFRSIYNTINNYNFEEANRKDLFKNLKKNFEKDEITNTYCGKAKDVFFKPIRTQLKEHKNILNLAICLYEKSMNKSKEELFADKPALAQSPPLTQKEEVLKKQEL